MKLSFLWLFGMVVLCVEGGRRARTMGLNPSPPTFVHPAQNVTVIEGQEVSLMCSVSNVHGYKIAWVHEETQSILSIGSRLYTQIPRLSLNADRKFSSLTISPVLAQDRGWYMCQLNTDPMTSSRSYLQVLVPPQFMDDWSGSFVEAREGASVQLTCNARAFPPPKVTWRRVDAEPIFLSPRRVFVIEGPELIFPSVRRAHGGAYTCHVDNEVTSPISRTTHLTVTYTPMLWVEQELVGTKAGVDITLNCSSAGNPPPLNYWTVDDKNITSRDSKYDLEEIRNDTRMDFHLTIRNPGKGDFTYYQCHAASLIGNAEGTIRLYEIHDHVVSVVTRPPLRTTTQEPKEIPKSSPLPSESSPISHSSNKIRDDNQRRKNMVNNRVLNSNGKGQIYTPRKINAGPGGKNKTFWTSIFDNSFSSRSGLGWSSMMQPYLLLLLVLLVHIWSFVDSG